MAHAPKEAEHFEATPKPARFGWADGLRGIAALAVLAYEVLEHAPNLHWANPLAQRAALATAHGFDALLMLSGLLLAYPVLRALRRDGSAELSLARYAFGRALRILPLYYLALAATLLVPVGAAAFGVGGLSHSGPAPREAFAQALFAAGGLENDGFAALTIQVRLLALFPVLLAIYAFAPGILAALAGLALYVDYATPAHHFGVGAAPALMLGIVAADVLARELRVGRFAWPLALLAAAAAFALDPIVAGLPQPLADPLFLNWNPLWALAAAALAVACAGNSVIGRILGAHGFRQLGGASYALILVAEPVSAFALGHAATGAAWLPFAAAGISLVAAFALWLILDRAVTSSRAYRALPGALAKPLESTATMTFGVPRPVRRTQSAPQPVRRTQNAAAPLANPFGPLPTMHPGMLATVVQHVGSLDDLHAEIELARQRLAETAAFYQPAEYVSVPEQLVLAPAELALEREAAPPQLPLPLPRTSVTLALGASRPPRPTVRVSFGPGLEGARAG